MSCVPNPNTRFTITRGVDNTFDFIIKGNGTTLPIEVHEADTVTAVFKLLEDGTDILTKELDVTPNLSGRVTLSLSATETEMFESLRGGPEDRYYIKPNYSLLLICDTTVNGKFMAKVDVVYVD